MLGEVSEKVSEPVDLEISVLTTVYLLQEVEKAGGMPTYRSGIIMNVATETGRSIVEVANTANDLERRGLLARELQFHLFLGTEDMLKVTDHGLDYLEVKLETE